ncbi:MAG: MBL fold metallo-hydrolase, partial [Bacillota bacterium]|nr:MBL fold metallo-hydrolase [Bacillota bacterium]
MKIIRIPAGMLGTNFYILSDEASAESAVIDPGGDAEKLISAIEKSGTKVKYILLTHGHFDHTGAVTDLKKKYNVPVCINREDYDMIKSGISELYTIKDDDGKIYNFIDDGSTFHLGNMVISTIATPGHTPGGVCFYVENILISGDTLFEGSVGRTDFPGADHDTLINSIKTKLMGLPEDTIVLPGHGGETTIG